MIAIVPNRTDSMDHIFGVKCKSRSDDCPAGRAVADLITSHLKLMRTCRSKDSTADTAAHSKTAVCSIDNAISI